MLHESLKNFRGYAEISSVESVQEAKPIHKKKLFWLSAHLAKVQHKESKN